jgi:signal transduction histidine kinase
VEPELSEFSEEQIRANRFALVSRLADDLAHEIKNPLNAIVINLEVLKVRITKGEAGAAIERAGVIEHEVRRLHRLVEHLLRLIRPEREEASSLPLQAALDELLPLLEAQTRLAGNELHTDCGVAVFVAVRRDAFKFAMLNLFSAVHEHLGEGGGTLIVRCVLRDPHVEILIEAVPAADHPVQRSAAADSERAVALAAALLAPSGARIDPTAAGVSVKVPLAAPV